MRFRVMPVVFVSVTVLLGAASATLRSQGSGGRGSPSRSTPTSPSFTDTIAPMVYANCVTCHRPGEVAPFSLISYEDVVKKAKQIARVTEEKYMPPWHAVRGYGEFVGERGLTDAQIATIGTWVKNGMPRGDESKMPKLPVFPPDGWRLGQPDLILEMPAGFDLPASGPDVFRNFVIPTKLTEDKWVRGIEFRPSARKVVHHALFAQVAGGSLAARDGADGRPGFGGMGAVGVINDRGGSRNLGGWAVGATPTMFPEGFAALLPKGSDFLLQMHFHLSGKSRDREVVDWDLLCRQGASEESLLGRVAGAFRCRRRHRYSIRRDSLYDSRFVHLAGRRERVFGNCPRALPREGDEGYRHAA